MPHPPLRRYFRHGLFPQLVVFEAAARLGSITGAAEELHLAQPTASTQLKKLADTLGVALFEQRRRRLHLLPAGQALLAACGELNELFTRIEARLACLRENSSAVLHISATPGARFLTGRLLAVFCNRHPEVQASLFIGRRAELLERLDSGADEFCMLSAPEPRSDLIMQPLAVEPLCIYGAAGHPWARLGTMPASALASQDLVVREPGARLRAALLAACAGGESRLKTRAELASNEAVAEAIAGGLGIGLLPEGEARGLVRAGAIAALDVEGFPLFRKWNLTQLKGGSLSAIAALFRFEASADAEPAVRPEAAGGHLTEGQA